MFFERKIHKIFELCKHLIKILLRRQTQINHQDEPMLKPMLKIHSILTPRLEQKPIRKKSYSIFESISKYIWNKYSFRSKESVRPFE